MPDRHLGEIFAGLTAICWTVSAVLFEYAGRRIGSLAVNLIRMSIATVLLAGLALAWRGTTMFEGAGLSLWLWVGLSGVLGFFICDMCLFRAYVLVGARRTMLIASLAPVFAAVLDYTLLRTPLSGMQVLGMLLTLSGVAWVILGRGGSDEATPHSRADTRRGAVLALIAAMGQALGASAVQIGTDMGDGQRFDPVVTTLIRVIAGTTCFALLIACLGWGRRVAAGLGDRPAMTALSAGAVIGPVAGVTFFVASLQHTEASVTQTIVATIPVLILPFAYFQKHERIGPRAILGAALAVAGVIVISLR